MPVPEGVEYQPDKENLGRTFICASMLWVAILPPHTLGEGQPAKSAMKSQWFPPGSQNHFNPRTASQRGLPRVMLSFGFVFSSFGRSVSLHH